MQRWTDVISKVPGKDARFYHLIMLLWLAEGQIACLSSLNNFPPSTFASSHSLMFPFFKSMHTYVSSVHLSAKVLSFLLAFTGGSKRCIVSKTCRAMLSYSIYCSSSLSAGFYPPLNGSDPFPGCLAHVLSHLSL